MKLYDITQEVFTCRVYPGDPAPERKKLSSIAQVEECNLSAFSMCAHNGTHADAPGHFLEGGKTAEQISLQACVGAALVAEAAGPVTKAAAAEILSRLPESGRRLLLKGDCVVTQEAAAVWAAGGLLLLGVESQTVGRMEEPAEMASGAQPVPAAGITEVHRILLEREVVVLEGLVLSEVPAGFWFLAALPLKLGGSDGAPVRAVLWREEDRAERFGTEAKEKGNRTGRQ